MASVLADRAMKARKASKLACGCYVRVGHRIARVAGQWICVEHLLEGRDGLQRRNRPRQRRL